MIKYLIITIIIFSVAHSRENPFFPAKGEQGMPTTSNKDLSVAPLKRAAISLPSSARRVEKVTVTYKNLDGSIENKSIDLNNAIDWHLPIFVSQSMGVLDNNQVKSVKPKKYTHLYTSKNIKFYKKEKELKVVTKDQMIRSFLLTNPHRVVFDFKKDVNLKSETKDFSTSIFKKLTLGTHDGYYRAVIVLDGQYKFNKSKQPYGYSIYLR